MSYADVRPDPLLLGVSQVVWRLPGRAATKMAEFAHTEAGSGLDMLEATELTTRPDMRRKYFIHALDELRHSRMFRQRASALSQRHSRTRAVLEDSGYIATHGIRGADPLFTELGEVDFLAFVWLAERRGAQQFGVYCRLMAGDPLSQAMFAEIERDEKFHIAYSRHELDQLVRRGQGADVRRAVWRIRGRRAWQAWLRLSRVIGDTVAGLWLTVLYLVVMAPFALIARLSERSLGGLCAVESDPRPLPQRAVEQV